MDKIVEIYSPGALSIASVLVFSAMPMELYQENAATATSEKKKMLPLRLRKESFRSLAELQSPLNF